MSKTWLILDVSYLAYRGFHSLGLLQYAGNRTGVVFSVLRDIRILMDEFATHDLVFAFDGQGYKRKQLDPAYKAHRIDRKRTPEEEETYRDIRRQIMDLRNTHLPDLGYRNVFWQDGYEADDVIASVCQGLHRSHSAVIVSADQDLYQLVSPNVTIYNPQKKEVFTERLFREKFLGLSPSRWKEVKAVAGCKSDGVPGVFKVGEITAAKFLVDQTEAKPEPPPLDKVARGKGRKVPVKEVKKTFQQIEEFMRTDRYKLNLQLTSLPFPGYEPKQLHHDPVNHKAWRTKCEELGIRSIKTIRTAPAFFGRTHAQA